MQPRTSLDEILPMHTCTSHPGAYVPLRAPDELLQEEVALLVPRAKLDFQVVGAEERGLRIEVNNSL